MTSTRYKPREWQRRALALWAQKQQGVIRVVTGGGKTIFAQMCVEHFRSMRPEGRVLIIVPTTALLDQWAVSLIEDSGISTEQIACYSGEEQPQQPRAFNIAVINTARVKSAELTKQGDWMLVVDECHRAGSEMNARALNGKYQATLGLSATPEREYDEGFAEWIKPVLGPVVFDYGYVDAVRDGVVSPFALHNVRVPLLANEEKEFHAFSRKIRGERMRLEREGGSEEKLIRLLQRRGAFLSGVMMRIPAAAKLVDQHSGKRTIIFHERVDAANELVEILKARAKSVTAYHAGISPILRRDNLRLYRQGVYEILVCCRALDEGINVPETAVAILASSTSSTRQRIQRLGRVLRPAPGKEFAEIYTIYASDLEERRLLEEAARLNEVANTSWSRVRSPGNGQNFPGR